MLISVIFTLIFGCSQEPTATTAEQPPGTTQEVQPAPTPSVADKTTPPTPTTVAAPPKPKQATPQSTGNDVVVGSWSGGSIKYSELYAQIEDQLAQKHAAYLLEKYNMEKEALETKIIEQILDEEAKKLGLADKEALMKQEIDDKINEPTEKAIQDFYNLVKDRANGAPLELIKDRIVASLKQQEAQLLMQVFLDNLKSKYKMQMSIPFPDLPRVKVDSSDDPYIGAENAEITIVQFAEYQCPYCSTVNQEIDKVIEAYPGKVKMVFRDFPLSFHQDAVPAAIAANCAGEQGKYWDMYKILMANQSALKPSNLTSYASSLGLDMSKWNTCIVDPKQQAEVEGDLQDGLAAGVNGTPSFFVNGIKLTGGFGFEQFKEMIDRELQNK